MSKGEPLFRVYSPQIQLAQTDLIVAIRAEGRCRAQAEKALEGADATPAQSRSSAEVASTKSARRDQPEDPRLAVAR